MAAIGQLLEPGDVLGWSVVHQHIQLQWILWITDSIKTPLGQAWSIHFSVAAVYQHDSVGLAAPAAQLLQEGKKATVTSAAKPLRAIAGLRGGHGVADTHEQGHLCRRNTIFRQLKQLVRIVGSRADVERLPKWSGAVTPGHMLIDQDE